MRVHDTTPEFVNLFEATRGKTDEEKLERFWSDLYPANPAFYDLRLSKWQKEEKKVEEELLRELEAFGTYHSEFVRLQSSIPKQLEDAVASFQKVFPDFNADFDVYLLHSLKEMNGGMRKLEGKHVFILGLDMIARFHTWRDNAPFFHHELLHVYLKQLHVPASTWYESETLLLKLWEEGLATYVSYLLNPQTSYAELMLGIPDGLPEQAWTRRAFLADDLAHHLSSTNEVMYRKYFVPWSGYEEVPERAGYFVGFAVLNELAKQQSLSTLLKPFNELELLELVRTQLLKLEALPGDLYLPSPPPPGGADTVSP